MFRFRTCEFRLVKHTGKSSSGELAGQPKYSEALPPKGRVILHYADSFIRPAHSFAFRTEAIAIP